MALKQFEPKKIYIRVNVQPITTPWIYRNQDLWLISLSSDGSNWLTIADKNLWATSTDISSTASYGNYYQRWNNHPRTYAELYDGVTSVNSTVNASNYWPWNYYNGSTFYYYTNTWAWESSNNTNLRWYTTWTVEAMRWPCDEWWHIPSSTETKSLRNIYNNLWLSKTDFTPCTYLLIPISWQARPWLQNVWTLSRCWTSSPLNWNSTRSQIISISSSVFDGDSNQIRWAAMPIRPFKNEPVQPDISRTVLYQPS